MPIVWGVGTPRTLRAHWMLAELGMEYETRPIGSRTGETQTPEYLQLNPNGKIPVLQDGAFTLCESAAIVNYLADTYGGDQRLAPQANTAERARYDQWCFLIMTELDATAIYVIRRHLDLAETYGEAPAAVAAARKYFTLQLTALEQTLADGRPNLLGDDFTGADLLLVSCLDAGIHFEAPFSDAMEAYRLRHAERPAYRQAMHRNRRPTPPQS